MADKKFTDEEIIETLERCSKGDGCFGCAKASMHSANCIRILETECLDLINRQKAEIERLKSELSNTRRKALLEASSKFAGHSNYHGDTILCKLICMAEGQEVGIAIPLDMSEMKANAYKKFAERLCEGKVSNDKTVIEAKVLLKEMVGEEE